MLCLLISFFFLLSCINAWLFIYSNLNKFKTNVCVFHNILMPEEINVMRAI